MNRKTAIAAVLAVITGLPMAAMAADTGWYGAFDLGQSRFNGLAGEGAALGANPSISDSDTGYRLSGGYAFNQYWGLEASYVEFGQGEIDVTTTTPSSGTASAKVKAHGFVFAGTGTYPFTDQWSGFARLGMIDGHKEVTVTGTGSLAGLTTNPSSTDWKVAWGLGVNWAFAPHWVARAGWDQYRNLGNQNTTGEDNVNLASIGIVYYFGS